MKYQYISIRQSGFSLVELLAVICILLVLGALGVLQYRDMSIKASIRQQLDTIFAELTDARVQALFKKTPRAVKITSTGFSVFPGTDVNVDPLSVRRFAHPVVWSTVGSSYVVRFDTWGVTDNLGSICVDGAERSVAPADCLVISRTRIRMGKRDAGALCKGENIH